MGRNKNGNLGIKCVKALKKHYGVLGSCGHLKNHYLNLEEWNSEMKFSQSQNRPKKDLFRFQKESSWFSSGDLGTFLSFIKHCSLRSVETKGCFHMVFSTNVWWPKGVDFVGLFVSLAGKKRA